MGWLMLVAFCAMGGSLAALRMGLYFAGAGSIIVVLLWIAAGGFVGAGVVRLDVNANVHIGFVALSFVTVALSMYLLPGSNTLFQGAKEKVISWALAIGLGVSVALGSGMVPAGVGQRLSAMFLILWSIWVGVKLSAIVDRADA